ncbi:hypothetical protein VitviT2T_028924 [Vitis vinifera]|uniref:N-acetyltransferase domain-containing protein n=4 Tax=Vitis vinifera TaxID=29760 RepID=A0ABY9DUT5_VITVI|nr:GCN5-related N-acetyltransferase 10, chloroplastic [Vitis vinifera]RVW12225.1 hypothetical protein CK203_084264 [Vitis vinifera]WKA11425.1 hypothetical protein VitviT2T_028924 [Vitis vinifera]|eukprot:XP_019071767.1 PREDICTED: uncharacterized protein LOC100244789 [Vitis vinifera]
MHSAMASFHSKTAPVFQKHYTEPSCRYTGINNGGIGIKGCGKSWRINIGKTRLFKGGRGSVVQCCSSSSTPSAEDQRVLRLVGKVGLREKPEYGKDQFGCLVNEYGWKVRRLVEEDGEMRKVAQVQAQAFHVPVALFNDLFFEFFQAEVLSGLVYKLRNSPPDRYACLVAEPAAETQQEVVGVVDVTALRDEAVLQHLGGAEEYLYVSGIAVLNDFRRQKVATALLKACDMLSILWGFEYLVLRAYEDDLGARKLYSNSGYSVVSGDPPWTSTWLGKKRRVVMVKRSNLRE